MALGWALGRARGLAPVALVVGGGALLLRPVLPALRPLRTGALCVFASVTLALAAGTLGVSSGGGRGHIKGTSWTSAFLQAHGGVVGEALYQAAHRLVQSVGVDILVVFLFLVGVMLLTGASLASVIRATGQRLWHDPHGCAHAEQPTARPEPPVAAWRARERAASARARVARS